MPNDKEKGVGLSEKSYNKETEIKYIVFDKDLPLEIKTALGAADFVTHYQGYFPMDGDLYPGARIRKIVNPDRSIVFESIIDKVATDDSHTKIEVELEGPGSEDLFNNYWPLTDGQRVVYERREVMYGGIIFQFDRFIQPYLPDQHMLEVEFDNLEEAYAFVPPDWVAHRTAITKHAIALGSKPTPLEIV